MGERDEMFRRLLQQAKVALAADETYVLVDPRDLMAVLATMDAYRAMAGLGSLGFTGHLTGCTLPEQHEGHCEPGVVRG